MFRAVSQIKIPVTDNCRTIRFAELLNSDEEVIEGYMTVLTELQISPLYEPTLNLSPKLIMTQVSYRMAYNGVAKWKPQGTDIITALSAIHLQL